MGIHRIIGWAAVGAIAALAACSTDTRIAPTPASVSSAAPACDACHPGDARNWRETYHAKVAKAPHEALVKEAAQFWAMDSKGNPGPLHGNVDGRTYGLEDVEMVVGTRWKQRFLVKNPANGHHQFLDKQWNSYTNVWEAYSNRDDWDAGCVTCHGDRGRAARVVVDMPAADH
jgi:cytochrome c553